MGPLNQPIRDKSIHDSDLDPGCNNQGVTLASDTHGLKGSGISESGLDGWRSCGAGPRFYLPMPTSSSPDPSGQNRPVTQDRTAAAAGFIRQALAASVLDVAGLLRALRERALPPDLLAAMAEDRRVEALYPVRARVCMHPATPLASALRLAPSLGWRDLARASSDPQVNPSLRARTDRILAEKLEEISRGELTSLARIASRQVIKALCGSREPAVVAALLENPQTVEDDVAGIAGNKKTPSGILSAIARSRRWADSHAVRLALALNSSCPFADALRALAGLPDEDLARIAADPEARPLVRMGAARHLDAGAGGTVERR